MLTILIADDHPVVRKGVRHILREAAEIGEIYETATWEETLDGVGTYKPDVVVMNTTLVDANSLEVLLILKQKFPGLPVILYHPDADPEFARRALQYGADGVVTKLSPGQELVNAVHTAATAGIYVCTVLAAKMNDLSGFGPI
jgi:two-component system, NarL family, invasion response regulator UvrY